MFLEERCKEIVPLKFIRGGFYERIYSGNGEHNKGISGC